MSSVDDRARFEWKTFGRTLVVWVIDFALATVFVVAVWCFVYYWVFSGSRIEATAHEVSEVVSAIAWPVSLVLFVLLFRNPLLRILNEIPSFIKRSYYRLGEEHALDPDDDSKKLGGDDKADEVNGVSKKDCCHAERVENAVGRMLVNKYGGRYLLEKCIGNRRYIFDVVIETSNRLFGVEIKKSTDTEVWGCILDRVQNMYVDFPTSLKQRFVFVPVVPTEAIKREVEQMAGRFEYKTIVELFDANKEED